MSRTDYIYSDKLSLELFREDKRPSTNVGSTSQGLLFINTKPTGSTKLAIRPKTGQFIVGEQDNQNPTASVHAKTNYLLFCNSIHQDLPVPNCNVPYSTTNLATLEGEFVLEKFGALDTKERTVTSLLKEIEKDPNLVVLYNHDVITGYYSQTLISPYIMAGAKDAFYIELDGVHINSAGENLIEAMVKYGDAKRLLIDPYGTTAANELITQSAVMIENRDHLPHTLYIRYIGNDAEIMQNVKALSPILQTEKQGCYQVDPDGLGIKITYAPLHKAYVTVFPWYQYAVGTRSVVGNRYVVEVNGVPYHDSRDITDLYSPTASLAAVVDTNPELAKLITINSGGDYNEIVNISGQYLDIKIYLDETVPYHQNNKTVDNGNNPAGIYKKLDYPYGTSLSGTAVRKANTIHSSVFIGVSTNGYSFRLGPYVEYVSNV